MSTTSGDHRDGGTTRPFAALGAAVVLLGIADSMVGSYLVLFASQQAHLTATKVGVFVSAPALGGLAISTVAGRRFDRRPSRTWAMSAAAISAVGFAILTTTTSFVVLVLVALTLLAALQAVFPQLFALARVVLGDGAAGRRSAPLLRSGWSLAWAIGPLAGAALLTRSGYDAVLWVAVGLLVLVVVGVVAVPAPRTPPATATGTDPETAPTVRPIVLALLVTGVTLFFLALYSGSVALPLFVTDGLHEPASTVGLLYSACAAMEVLVALMLAALPQRTSQRALIAVGMVALVAYFLITVTAHGLDALLVGQVARGVAIAVVGAAGIRLFQDLLHPATGRATTLFANATTGGSLFAGVLAGLSVQRVGFVTTLLLCAAAALAATVVFVVATAPRLTGSTTPRSATP